MKIGIIVVALTLLALLLASRRAAAWPVSDHFDGRVFRNLAPGTEPAGLAALLRWQTNRAKAEWPQSVAVTPARPAAHVDGDTLVVTAVGHATLLIQTQGLNILTDPVWSERVSPVSFAGPKRVRAPGVRFEDLPKIDLVLVSHGHYDHLDVPTLARLWARDRPRIITPLGHGALLKAHGIASEEGDWGAAFVVSPVLTVHIDRVQHWTSRTAFDRNRALWAGFTLALPGGNVFFAGDCGYDASAFKAAARHGPVRLALLPVGAYEPRWFMAASHMNPADAVAAMRDLGAAYAIGIHWGVWQLTDEAIDAPPRDLATALTAAGVAPGRFRALVPGEVWPMADGAPAASDSPPPESALQTPIRHSRESGNP